MKQLKINNIYNMDCLEGMKQIPSKSIDMILCDLPYGTTNCRWDEIIPFEQLWSEYERVIRDDGVIALTAAQPFTTKLIMSNLKRYKYNWYWIKNNVTGFASAKYQPLRQVEEVCIFYKKGRYFPQGLIKLDKPIKVTKKKRNADFVYNDTLYGEYTKEYTNYPKQVLNIKCERGLHPTQKPVELFEYLIKTYTLEGETVLDNCMGSGTTAIACLNTNRNFIGFEKDAGYYEVINNRIEAHMVER